MGDSIDDMIGIEDFTPADEVMDNLNEDELIEEYIGAPLDELEGEELEETEGGLDEQTEPMDEEGLEEEEAAGEATAPVKDEAMSGNEAEDSFISLGAKRPREELDDPTAEEPAAADRDSEITESEDGLDASARGAGTPAPPLRDPSTIASAKSAYLWFCEDHRAQVKQSHPEALLGEMQRILSDMWKELGEADRAKWAAVAAADKERHQRELREAGLDKPPAKSSDGAPGVHPTKSSTIVMPLARVRKIMKLDPEVKNATAEGASLVAKATDIFIALMAERACGAAQQSKRRGLRLQDVSRVVSSRRELWFLREEFQKLESFASSTRQTTAAPLKKAAAPVAGHQSITVFMRSSPSTHVALAEAVDVETMAGVLE